MCLRKKNKPFHLLSSRAEGADSLASPKHLECGKHQAHRGAQHSGPDCVRRASGPSSGARLTARKSTRTNNVGGPSSVARTKEAWKFFPAQPPWYQRTASCISAKKEETRLKRLAQLIEDTEHERTIGELRRPASRKAHEFVKLLNYQITELLNSPRSSR
jgi:Bacteriocin-protection, YdeI or OmpD-Associated